jgi:hypothetical protein
MNDDKGRSTKIERAKQMEKKDKRTLVQQQIDEASKQSDELLRNVSPSSSFHPSAIVQKLLLSGFGYLTRKPLFALRWNWRNWELRISTKKFASLWKNKKPWRLI